MEQRGHVQLPKRSAAEPEPLAGCNGEVRRVGGMPEQVWRLEIDHVGEYAGEQAPVGDGVDGWRFDRKHQVPWVAALQPTEDLCCVASERLHNRRIEGATGPGPDRDDGGLRPTRAGEVCCDLTDLDHPSRRRDLLPFSARKPPCPFHHSRTS
jgi:hypothetical protein